MDGLSPKHSLERRPPFWAVGPYLTFVVVFGESSLISCENHARMLGGMVPVDTSSDSNTPLTPQRCATLTARQSHG